MNKFITLLKKEIRELLTPAMVIPLVITMVIFMAIGNLVGNETEKNLESQTIWIVDNDQTNTSASVIEFLQAANYVPEIKSGDTNNIINDAKQAKQAGLIVIPDGFEENLNEMNPASIDCYTILKSFSMTGSMKAATMQAAIDAINTAFSDATITNKYQIDPAKIKTPVARQDHVIIGDKESLSDPQTVMSFITSQTTFIPIILFLVIIMAAQMLAVAVASEKENKSLEILLSAPVDRRLIVMAKMVGAGIVAFLMAAVYMFGFRYYMNGLSGGETLSNSSPAIQQAITDLGLKLSVPQYALLGLSLFAGILCALAIAMILGSFADSEKNVQAVITPLMVLVMVPYFLVLFLDFNSLAPVIRYVVMAIPFAHPFMAAPNLFLGNYGIVWGGIVYQFIVFMIFVFIAAKLFTTDKIMTIRLKMGKKK